MQTVVFDLDGTLVDTAADLVAAANACFRARDMGNLLDPAADARTAFHGGRAMLALGHARAGTADAAQLIEEDYLRLLGHYADHICVHSRLYPGAAGAVAALRTAGYRTAICTNKPEGLARNLLDKLGVTGLFDALIGADTLPTRKPDPAPYHAAVERAGGAVARSLLIGDTKTDRETALAVGVPCVLVSFGPEGRDIARLDPEAMLDSYADLSALIARFLPLHV
ncbi:phosphoglycolate phosphatase [Rhodobacter aestuarii]|uniref:phosphoglycolate phosphatase n=1 Tax=Rhodobacter aestuarii TaxID=453582 RepID=A0A1N7P764_9RHOB|nr:HAD-IA family hydrolase [Rhodobacter aestuarii]PTV97632.1 phosphoglycolate phosphatase [Rhodobacter aestuarii]SIT06377.1 phosphoglycolate phosphatase [Rhodobacter aestuarii]